MKRFLSFPILVILSIISISFLGCDGMNTSSEPAPLTYGVNISYLGVQYPVTSGDTMYFYTGESLVIGSPFIVNQDGSYTQSTQAVEVIVGGTTYQTGHTFSVGPGTTLLVTVDGYAFQVATAATPNGRLIGDLGLRNRTWGDVYGNLSLHYTGSSDILDVMVWKLTGWEQETALVYGGSITAFDENGVPAIGSNATTVTVNPGTVGDTWVQLVKAYTSNIHLWVAPGTMPTRSTGTDVRMAADFNNGSTILAFAVPTGFTSGVLEVTITGSVFNTYTKWIGIDSSGYGVEYMGEPRGTGQSYTIVPTSGQGVDTTPIVVTAN